MRRSLAVLLLVLLAAAAGRELGVLGDRPPSRAGSALVERVVDGDTIVAGGERVRLIGVDTPESVKPGSPVECFGREASALTKRLVGSRRVRLVRDVEERDRYGRLLAYVYRDGLFVNAELVRRGYASVATFPPNVRHAGALLRAQRQARRAGRGLWSACRSS